MKRSPGLSSDKAQMWRMIVVRTRKRKLQRLRRSTLNKKNWTRPSPFGPEILMTWGIWRILQESYQWFGRPPGTFLWKVSWNFGHWSSSPTGIPLTSLRTRSKRTTSNFMSIMSSSWAAVVNWYQSISTSLIVWSTLRTCPWTFHEKCCSREKPWRSFAKTLSTLSQSRQKTKRCARNFTIHSLETWNFESMGTPLTGDMFLSCCASTPPSLEMRWLLFVNMSFNWRRPRSPSIISLIRIKSR